MPGSTASNPPRRMGLPSIMKNWSLFFRLKKLIIAFKIPLLLVLGITTSLVVKYIFHLDTTYNYILLIVVFSGSIELIKETLNSILQKKLALDYIALLAITVGIISQQYLVAAIIVLMLSGGNTLEEYGMSQARQSLTALTERIPSSVFLWEGNTIGKKVNISDVTVGQEIAIRKGEVIPLDGILQSDDGFADESTLTGEPYLIDKIKGDQMRSGTINIGNVMVIKVTKEDKDSTYRKIIEMVKSAQKEKAPLIRLADQYSTIFTIITLALAGLSYFISSDMHRVLAVLVIATPCPLILATPIALMGGMNAAAKKRIILKKISSIEVLARVNAIIFDKTGTITLGRPFVKRLIIDDPSYNHEQICSIAEAIERNSLHPLAKAIVESAKEEKHQFKKATKVVEHIGSGISGEVDGILYTLSKIKNYNGMAIQVIKGEKRIAIIEFEDKIKEESKDIIRYLKKLGLHILIFTGDKKEAAKDLIKKLGQIVTLKAECTPEDKKNGILSLKKEGKVTAMVGDGINDAPALAMADVGMVFSNEEHTAASEAADIVFLGGDFASVTNMIGIAKRSIQIALQSILFGIGVSTIGMILAAFGFIPPIVGAFLQETVDIIVIFNALRASR